MLILARPGADPHLTQPFLALDDDKVVPEDLKVLEQHIVPMGDHFLPMLPAPAIKRRPHQLEVLSLIVGQDVKVIAEVIDLVFVVRLAR